jgi:hypothetical protein
MYQDGRALNQCTRGRAETLVSYAQQALLRRSATLSTAGPEATKIRHPVFFRRHERHAGAG